MVVDNLTENLDKVLREEMTRIIGRGLADSSELLNNFDQIKMVAGWYKEAKEHPKEIPNIIVNGALGKILNYLVSPLSNNILDSVSAKIDIHRNELVIEKIEIDFSIKPFVEYVKKLNSVDSAKVKLTFEIGITGALHNIKFGKENNRIMIERFVGILNISIVSIDVKLIVVSAATISLPIKLCTTQFEIKNMSSTAPRRVSPI
jgi:hypothetical protein